MFLLAFGVLNFGLGFCCAYALGTKLPWEDELAGVTGGWLGRPAKAPAAQGTAAAKADAPAASAASSDKQSPAEAPFALDSLPKMWLEELAAEEVIPGSFVEASAHVIRLEVGRYREQLVTAENRARAYVAEGNADSLALLADDLQYINQDWLQRQRTAAEMLARRQESRPEYDQASQDLAQVLHDQAALIQDVGQALAGFDFRAEIDTGGKRILEKLAALLDQAHALRDRIGDLVAALLRTEGRLDSVGSQLQLDRASGLPNRVGLETIFHEWWREDPARSRPLSVALVDLDRFARINQRLGTRAGDRTLVAFGRLLADVIRKDRGYDRIARVAGQQFLLFYGDTAACNGITAAERARQTLEATTWHDQGDEFDLAISCGVVDVQKQDQLPDVLRRARAALRCAQQAGRNRTACDDGAGPKLCAPPQFPIKSRVIEVGADG